MKAQKIQRIMRAGRIESNRTVIALRMTKQEFASRIEPLDLERVHVVRGCSYAPYAAHAEILVKTFEPDVNYEKARQLRALFRRLRLQGIEFTVLPRPPGRARRPGRKHLRHPGFPKSWISPPPLDPNPVPRLRRR